MNSGLEEYHDGRQMLCMSVHRTSEHTEMKFADTCSGVLTDGCANVRTLHTRIFACVCVCVFVDITKYESRVFVC